MSKKIKRVKYTGGKSGDFIGGVPMRDLDADEWAALTKEQREYAKDSGLYEVEYEEPEPQAAEPKAKASTKE